MGDGISHVSIGSDQSDGLQLSNATDAVSVHLFITSGTTMIS